MKDFFAKEPGGRPQAFHACSTIPILTTQQTRFHSDHKNETDVHQGMKILV